MRQKKNFKVEFKNGKDTLTVNAYQKNEVRSIVTEMLPNRTMDSGNGLRKRLYFSGIEKFLW